MGREARNGDNYAGNGNAKQCKKLQKHEEVRRPHAQLGRNTIQQRNESESADGHALINPRIDRRGISPNECTNDVFAKNDSDDGCRARFEHADRRPSEKETGPFAKDLGQVDLSAAIQRYRASQLCV
jgi:hypothetical protein